jgi:hypothetical protein
MIKHIVMFRLKDEFQGALRTAKAVELKSALDEMRKKISSVHYFEAGINYNPAPFTWDLCIYAEFVTQQDLDQYQAHPAHQEFIKFNKSFSKEKAVADYIHDPSADH